MNVVIRHDEWYPVFTLEKSQTQDIDTIDVPDAVYQRYLKAEAEFEAVQEILRSFDRKTWDVSANEP